MGVQRRAGGLPHQRRQSDEPFPDRMGYTCAVYPNPVQVERSVKDTHHGKAAAGTGFASAPASAQAAREVRRNTPIRQARTCYGHLAGVAGVTLFQELVDRGWLEQTGHEQASRPSFCLTPLGVQALSRREVDLAGCQTTRRRFAYGCLDWTERRFHLGGALGTAIVDALQARGTLLRQQSTRVVVFRADLTEWLD